MCGIVNQLRVRAKVDKTVVNKDIENALARQAHTERKGVKGTVSDSQVTLTGVVHSWTEQMAVTTAACCAPGVTDVTDALTIH